MPLLVVLCGVLSHIYIAFTSCAFLVVSVTGALWKLNININEPCGGGGGNKLIPAITVVQ